MEKPNFLVELNNYKRVMYLLQEETSFAVDTETDGLLPYNGTKAIGISFYFPSANESHYLTDGNRLNLSSLKNKHIVMFNALFDLHVVFTSYGVDLTKSNIIHEVLVQAKLLNENEDLSVSKGAYRLKRLAVKYLGAWAGEGEKELEAFAKARGLNPKSEMWKLEPEEVYVYACFDTVITYKLHEFYKPYITAWNLQDLYKEECKFLQDFLFRTESNGVRVDTERMLKIQSRVNRHKDKIKQYIVRKFNNGNDINLNSPKQVSALLKKLGYDLPSTGIDFIRPLENTHLIFKALIQYRDLDTPNKLYYKKYPEYLNEHNLMHPNHFIGGAKTGRLTCSSPNTQQFSKKGDFKRIFIPYTDDYILFQGDLSQAELRVAVHNTGEPTMKRLMLEGKDLHSYTAQALTDMLNRPISRQLGKMANFGLLYRMSPALASQKFGIDLDLATDLVLGWRELYAGFTQGYYDCLNEAVLWRTRDGQEAEPFAPDAHQYYRLRTDGRVRHFSEAPRIRLAKERAGKFDVYKGEKYNAFGEIKTADRNLVLEPYDEHYKAFNFSIQGSIQSVMRKILLDITSHWSNDIFRPQMMVYDSVVGSVRRSHAEQFAMWCKERFVFNEWVVPLTMDVSLGETYKDMKDLK